MNKKTKSNQELQRNFFASLEIPNLGRYPNMKKLLTYVFLLMFCLTSCQKETIETQNISQGFNKSVLKNELIGTTVLIVYQGKVVTVGKWTDDFITFKVKVPTNHNKDDYKIIFRNKEKILFEGKALDLEATENKGMHKEIGKDN